MTKNKEQKPQMLTIEIDWTSTTPDPRPFNQQRHEYKPLNVSIVVTVPLSKEYVHNWDDHIQWQLGTLKERPKIGLTPLGQFACVHKLEEHYALAEILTAKEVAEENKNIDWEDKPTESNETKNIEWEE